MPYHVVIRGKSGIWTEMDLDAKVLRDQIAVPHLQREHLLVSQCLFHPDVVEELRIYSTDRTSAEILESLMENRAIGYRGATFVGTELVARMGMEVTEQVLQEASAFIEDNPEERSEAVGARSHIFVVHGRNLAARNLLFAMLQAMRLRPLWWEDAIKATARPSPFIGEVLDAAFACAQAVIVLFTGDDEARLRKQFWAPDDSADERELLPQARANVLFEAGMAFARCPESTVIATVGTTRRFSDIAGRHFVRLDSDTGHSALADQLRTCGCSFSPRPSWIKIGSFGHAS
jgi:predicted nucleotide-binding protein